MVIVVTGGGSGGHITPVLAVANELKQLNPDVQIVYIGQRGDGLGDVPAADPNIDHSETVSAGKLRRYHGEGWRQLFDLKTVGLNIRDVFRTVSGFFQALSLLGRYRPDAVFIKGGFVGVPVGLAAALLRIPYVTHDSDALPGLANRIVAPWAKYHAVSLPKDIYHYNQAKTYTVGVPTRTDYAKTTEADKKAYRQALGVDTKARVLFITGGGLGAQRINQAMVEIMHDLLQAIPDLVVFQTVGRVNEQAAKQAYANTLTTEEQGRVRVLGYTTELYRYSGAADLILMRAGATAIAEFARQGRACILVPNPVLTGGHQLKNAEVLRASRAVAILSEEDLQHDLPLVLSTLIVLLEDTAARHQLAENLSQFAHPNASAELATLILSAAKKTTQPPL
jgi:UDP-N-acetylglucosamine--N-acetylmuramyl-(pentapeptide) pyrophosphoryl-undecaprenol N-acetylglucosamine transferase